LYYTAEEKMMNESRELGLWICVNPLINYLRNNERKKKMKKNLIVIVSILICASLLGCTVNEASTENTETVSTESSEPIKIGYYGISTTSQFFKDIYDSLVTECDKRGYELTAIFTDYDPVKMRSAYDQFKLLDVDVIIDGNAIPDVMAPFAEQAASDGIPYIGLFVQLDEPTYTFGISNAAIGETVGEFVGKLIKDEWGGNYDLIVMVGTFQSAPEITERLTKAPDGMSKYVEVTDKPIVQIDIKGGDTVGIYQQTMDVLTANPDKKIAIFAQTDDVANSVFSAVEAAGRSTDVIGTGSDCVDIALDYFKAAVDANDYTVPWRGSNYLPAITYGDDILDIVEKILANEDVPHETLVDPVVVGIYNLYEVFPELEDK
jgi:ABC-type sugar transport system substrate-binding protein